MTTRIALFLVAAALALTHSDAAAANTGNCSLALCQNNATCLDLNVTVANVTTATQSNCTCVAGFSGAFCQTVTDNCVPNPCFSWQRCVSSLNAFTCSTQSDLVHVFFVLIVLLLVGLIANFASLYWCASKRHCKHECEQQQRQPRCATGGRRQAHSALSN